MTVFPADAAPTAAIPVPRWAELVARAAPLTTLPTGLWRIAMAVGLPCGFSATVVREVYHAPGSGSAYLVALSVTLEALALLTFGLVRPWGERLPVWVPRLGGRALPPRLVVAVAGTGSVLLGLIWIPTAVGWWFVAGDPPLPGVAHVAVGLLYLPLAAWGPMLAAVTVHYHRRHRPAPPTPA